jgi:uncharacterized membrane protein
MTTLIAILYTFHVLSAIAWLGGGIFMAAVLSPALAKMAPSAVGDASMKIGLQAAKFFPVSATLTILFGLAAAFAMGRFNSLSALLSTPYGWTTLAALATSGATYALGFLVGKHARATIEAPLEAKAAAAARLARTTHIEHVGFLATLVCMVLMRFGI